MRYLRAALRSIGPGRPVPVGLHSLNLSGDAAAYLAAVLRLLQTGSPGAFTWCYADHAPALWGRYPCDFQVHERFGTLA